MSGGGAERVVLNFASLLHNSGYPVTLVLFENKGPLTKFIPRLLPTYDLRRKKLRYSIIPLLFYIRKIKPKLIFSTFGYINLVLLLISPFFPKHTKIWTREANLPSKSLKNNQFSWFMWYGYKYLYQYTDLLIVTSEKMKIEFQTIFNIKKN